MTTRRALAMILSAGGTVALLALFFGNQWFYRWIRDSELVEDAPYGIQLILQWLQYPGWRIADGSAVSLQLSWDLSLLVLFGTMLLLILAGARALDPVRGAFGALLLGWWATAVAGVAAGLVRAFIIVQTEPLTEVRNTGAVYEGVMGAGALFGLMLGWLPGLAALLAFLITRPRGTGMPVPAQIPQGGRPLLPPDHPAARPYVVQDQPHPQNAPRGWAPPPPSPGAVPTGGFPVPQTPPAGYAPPMVHQAPPPAPPPAQAPPAPPDGIAAAQPAHPAEQTHLDTPPPPQQPAAPQPTGKSAGRSPAFPGVDASSAGASSAGAPSAGRPGC